MAKMYVIGDSQAGVLFIKTNPIRLALVPMANVLDYANAQPGDIDAIKQALGKVAGAAKKMMFLADTDPATPPGSDDAEDAIGSIIGGGGAITDAEFCFIADVEDVDWASRRFRCPPLEQPLRIISTRDGTDPSGGNIPEAELNDNP
jgi:hypothetical protein